MPNRSNPLCVLNAAGQSVWCDPIHRGMITSGGLARMIKNDDLVFAKAFDGLLHRIQTKVASLAA